MKKAMTIVYLVKNGLYINMTNKCPCACTFCLRQKDDGAYGSDPLWLEREPTVEEVCIALDKWDLSTKEEIVFCGYGEPTERLPDVLKVAKYIKEHYSIPIRVNTNGLSDLIWKTDTAPMFVRLVDTLSISLNATNAEDYLVLTRSKFGLKSFDALLTFAKNAKTIGLNVVMTIVDTVTTPEQQRESQRICDTLGVTLRIRPLE